MNKQKGPGRDPLLKEAAQQVVVAAQGQAERSIDVGGIIQTMLATGATFTEAVDQARLAAKSVRQKWAGIPMVPGVVKAAEMEIRKSAEHEYMNLGAGHTPKNLFKETIARMLDLDAVFTNECLGVAVGLEVRHTLDLAGLTKLEQLPLALKAEGSIRLSGCRALRKLPEGLRLRGFLRLDGCTSLEALPDDLQSSYGLFSMKNCVHVKAIPRAIRTTADMDLTGCTSLISLAEGTEVNGALKLRGCTSLVSLPQKLSVHGNLDLRGCSNWDGDLNGRNIHGAVFVDEKTAKPHRGIDGEGKKVLRHHESVVAAYRELLASGMDASTAKAEVLQQVHDLLMAQESNADGVDA